MVNYFALMGLSTSFNFDNNQLDTTFRQLQSQFHPDIAKSDITLNSSLANSLLANLSHEQASAVINSAYQTLKNPDSRATHLLELSGQATGLNASIRDLDFLDKAMDLRVSLEEAQMATLPSLKAELQNWLSAVEQDFMIAYHTQDWQTAQSATQQLKFLIKLQSDFAKKTDVLANEPQNSDDDLYV